MRRLCISSIVMLILAVGLHAKSAIFYYGDKILWSMLGAHDYIVLQPSSVATDSLTFKKYASKVYAYVSVIEREGEAAIGKNEQWNASIIDLRQADVRQRVIEHVAKLHAKGFRNFFFDTLDSYQLALPRKEWASYEAALVTFFHEVKRRFPKAKIIANRGFEIFDRIKDAIDAVAIESLFFGFDGQKYVRVDEEGRRWLLAKIEAIKQAKKDVIVIDYLPDPTSKEAKALVQRIASYGVIAYVGDGMLESYGTTMRDIIKREILLLYDGSSQPVWFQGVHQLVALPLEYMGYVPAYQDIRTFDFDPYAYTKYAGVVIWFDNGYKDAQKLYNWIVGNARHGLKCLILRAFPSDAIEDLAILGIEAQDIVPTQAKLIQKRGKFDFELTLAPGVWDTILQPHDAKPLVLYQVGAKRSVPAALTWWGGYVIGETSFSEVGEDTLWVVDPYFILPKALKLKPIPALDPTTENGSRLLFTHIDGDGSANKVEYEEDTLSIEKIYTDILKHYKIPHSVSIVEGETAPWGLYPKLSKRLEAAARKIYALPNVEDATHTYSHPFDWAWLSRHCCKPLPKKYRLPIKDYNFSVTAELKGSLEYIKKRLYPPNKPFQWQVFWSGDCLPPKEVLHFVEKNNYLNMNGGDTIITNLNPWLYRIAPYGLKKGAYYQVYTGAQNENVYTNEFTGPYWGYERVIQTFKLTDRPRRYKPIDVYYHFYSASKLASMRALKKVFEWALRQKNTMPIYTSYYIPKVYDFYTASIEKLPDGYRFHGLKALKTVRVAKELTPQLSDEVVGWMDYNNERYVALQPHDGEALLRFGSGSGVRLVHANVPLRAKEGSRYHFKGWQAVRVEFAGSGSCRFKADRKIKVRRSGKRYVITAKAKEVTLDAQCR